jgi:hypothetical protein
MVTGSIRDGYSPFLFRLILQTRLEKNQHSLTRKLSSNTPNKILNLTNIDYLCKKKIRITPVN